MKVTVIGASGLIGTKVGERLRAAGHEVVPASRDSGVDVLTGDGLVTGKSPTTPGDQSEGAIHAVEAALGAAGARAGDVERFVHGMTVGMNALLEGRVARTVLLATAGFTDLEELGRQTRPELYRLCAAHPPPIVPAHLRVAVPERTGPDGVLEQLDEAALREALAELDGTRPIPAG